MEVSKEPIISGSPCGRYKYKSQRCWDADLPTLGFVLARPQGGHWITDNELNWAVSLARRLDYGAVSVAYLSPVCIQPDAAKRGPANVPQLHRDRTGEALLSMIDESAAVVCAWGAHQGGVEALQYILVERPNTLLFHLGLTQGGHPLTLGQAAAGVLPTRWRV